MPVIKFRTTEYEAVSGVKYYDLSPDSICFTSTGSSFGIQVSGYSDIANVSPLGSLKRKRSTTNVRRIPDSSSGVVKNDILNFVSLPITNIPNWSSTLSINFGEPASTGSYNITSAKFVASGLDVNPYVYPESQKSNVVRINAFEICHTSASTGVAGSGSTSWTSFYHLSKNSLNLTRNPGPSGAYALVGSTGIPSNQHDWHIGMCIEPTDINVAPFIILACIIEYL
jgi:hypothetical protein